MNFNYYIANNIESKDLDIIKFECDYMANIIKNKNIFKSDMIYCIYKNETKNISIIFYIDLKGCCLYMGMIMNESEKRITDYVIEKDIYISSKELSDIDIKNILRVIYISENNLDEDDRYIFNNLFILALSNKLKNNDFIIDYGLLDSKEIKSNNLKEAFKRIIDKYNF